MFDAINIKLEELANSPDDIIRLGNIHNSINLDHTRCLYTSRSICSLNLLNQKYDMFMQDVTHFEENLKNDEEGIFHVQICEVSVIYVPNHSFIIIKLFENGHPIFKVVQSYVTRYDLKDYLDRTQGVYYNFNDLYEKVLKHVYTMIDAKSVIWNAEKRKSWLQLTGVATDEYASKKHTFIKCFVTRSTNNTPPASNERIFFNINKPILNIIDETQIINIKKIYIVYMIVER